MLIVYRKYDSRKSLSNLPIPPEYPSIDLGNFLASFDQYVLMAKHTFLISYISPRRKEDIPLHTFRIDWCAELFFSSPDFTYFSRLTDTLFSEFGIWTPGRDVVAILECPIRFPWLTISAGARSREKGGRTSTPSLSTAALW